MLGLALAGGLSASVGIAWVRASLSGVAWGGNDWVAYEGEASGIVGGHPVPRNGAFLASEFRSTGATDRAFWWRRAPFTDEPPFERELPAWSIVHDGPPPESTHWTYAVERAYGWPRRCLRVSWGYCEYDAYAGEALRGGLLIEEVDWGVPTMTGNVTPDFARVQVERHRALPLTPMWGGLATNSLLLAAPWLALALLLATPGILIRWRRHRRGRCVGCGYQVPESSACCPECGPEQRARVLSWGPRSGVLLGLLVLAAWAATLGFGAWRIAERTPLPPVHRAAVENDGDAIKQFAASGVPIDEDLPSEVRPVGQLLWSGRPLAWAATRGNKDAVAALIEAGADLDARNGRALRQAAQVGHAGVCRLLLEAGADSTLIEHGNDVFETALRYGDSDTIAVFVRFVPADDRRHLRAAVHEQRGVLEQLLRSSAWTQADMEAAMLEAARFGRVASIEVLLEHGLSTAECGEPLLYEAVRSGSAGAVRLLVEAGASGTTAYPYRRHDTPLKQAVAYGDPEIVGLVLKAGGNPRMLGSRHESVLHAAARTAPIAVIDLLIAAGAPIDHRPSYGGTALMEAVEHRRMDVIERLLAEGADPRTQDWNGRTALDYARGFTQNKYWKVEPAPPEVIRVLEEAMEAY